MRRTKEDTEISRANIIKAAKRIFTEKGYADTKLEDVGKAVGMTRGVVYWHFKNKADLFQYAVESAVDSMDNMVNEVFATDLPVTEQLRTLFLRSYEMRPVTLLQVIGPDKKLSRKFGRYMDEKRTAIIGKVKKALQAAQKKGKIKAEVDIKSIIGVLFVFTSGITSPKTSFMFMERDSESVKGMIDILFNGISSCQVR